MVRGPSTSPQSMDGGLDKWFRMSGGLRDEGNRMDWLYPVSLENIRCSFFCTQKIL